MLTCAHWPLPLQVMEEVQDFTFQFMTQHHMKRPWLSREEFRSTAKAQHIGVPGTGHFTAVNPAPDVSQQQTQPPPLDVLSSGVSEEDALLLAVIYPPSLILSARYSPQADECRENAFRHFHSYKGAAERVAELCFPSAAAVFMAKHHIASMLTPHRPPPVML